MDVNGHIGQPSNFGLEHERGQSFSSPFFITPIVLRVLIVLSTIAATCVMATSDETTDMFMVPVGLVCGLAVFSLVGVYFPQRTNSNSKQWFLVFLHDMIAMVLILSACGAATAIGYVGLKGQNSTAWFAVCDRVGRFCLRNGVSIGLSYVAFLCLFALTIMSAYRLKSLAASKPSDSKADTKSM